MLVHLWWQNVTKFNNATVHEETPSAWINGSKTKTSLSPSPSPQHDGCKRRRHGEDESEWDASRLTLEEMRLCVSGSSGGQKGNSCQRSLPPVITVHRGQRKCNFYTQALNRTDSVFVMHCPWPCQEVNLRTDMDTKTEFTVSSASPLFSRMFLTHSWTYSHIFPECEVEVLWPQWLNFIKSWVRTQMKLIFLCVIL